MRMGQQTEIDTPGQNAKQYIFGAVNQVTGELIWVPWTNKNNVGFRQLLKRVLETACRRGDPSRDGSGQLSHPQSQGGAGMAPPSSPRGPAVFPTDLLAALESD